MKLQVVGCSHHSSSIEVRERLAFTPEQAQDALGRLRDRFPQSEAVLLSTCNRVELYLASELPHGLPSHHDIVQFLAEYHGLDAAEVFDELYERTGEDAVRHLFMVAASLDSMVVGEAQILSQVKQAFSMARSGNTAGPLTHLAFEAANRVAKRVATETAINRKRVSIPSVAVADYASRLFETFDDKQILVIGAGDMGEETLRYLIDLGARQITIINRHPQRAEQLAARTTGLVAPWSQLHDLLVTADLVISTTGAQEPIVTESEYRDIDRRRGQQPIFILDLAVPRDFEPQISSFNNVYLYSIDDLKKACEENRKARQQEWPLAERIIDEETGRFMAELNHRATGPTIRRLKARADEVMQEELQRLLNKISDIEPRHREEVRRAFDRLVNKLLHPPLESLRDEARQGAPHGLLDALRRLFQIKD